MSPIDDYLSKLSPEQKAELERVRKIAHSAVTDLDEKISYGMPTLLYKNKPLIHFGAFKHHLSLFPASGEIVQNLGEELKEYHSSKGTLQFTADKSLPEPLIRKIVAIRKQEIDQAN